MSALGQKLTSADLRATSAKGQKPIVTWMLFRSPALVAAGAILSIDRRRFDAEKFFTENDENFCWGKDIRDLALERHD